MGSQAASSISCVATQDARSLWCDVSSKSKSDLDKAPVDREKEDIQTRRWLYLRRYMALGLCPNTPVKVEVKFFCHSITLVFNYLKTY